MATKERFGIERKGAGGWEHLAILKSEDAAIKRLQRERELDRDLVSSGWITKIGTYRITVVTGRIW